MKTLIKNARLQKQLKTRELAQALAVDQSLISKFENGTRKPTKEQIMKLSLILEIDFEILMVAWLKEKIYDEIGYDTLATKAINLVREEMLTYKTTSENHLSEHIISLLEAIDSLKNKLNQKRHLDSFKIVEALELEYTFESNRIEGNTFTLRETDLVVNEGLTISGKSMREHLEAINHQEAIGYIKYMMDKNTTLNERELLTLHNLILRGIMPEDAGKYRNLQVMIKGSSHTPPQPFLVAKQMEDFFIWFQSKKNKLHPVVLAAEVHEKIVSIHPFIDGNGRTSRLAMNLILLQNGYVIANIKGDYDTRMQYYNALEKAQTTDNKNEFIKFIAQTEKESLERYLKIIG